MTNPNQPEFTRVQLVTATEAVYDLQIAEANFQAASAAFRKGPAARLITAWTNLVKYQQALGFEFFAPNAENMPPASVRAALTVRHGAED